MNEDIKINSCILALDNLNKAKYGAAFNVLRIISSISVDVDFDELENILTDLDIFLEYDTNAQYIGSVIRQVTHQRIGILEAKISDIDNELFLESAKQIIRFDELNICKKVYKQIIHCLIKKIKAHELDFKVEIIIKNMKNIYEEAIFSSYEEANNHFLSIFSNFCKYHRIVPIKVEIYEGTLNTNSMVLEMCFV